jgi:formyl-CoA transferase
MREHQLPCTPVLTLDQVLKDPQARERQMIVKGGKESIKGTTYIGNPCKISGLGKTKVVRSPKLGQHTSLLLKKIGYTQSNVKGFIEAGIVQQSGS